MSDRTPRVILVCGLPGAGKTTLARRLAAEVGGVRLSPDEWLVGLGLDVFDLKARDRVEKRLWALAEDLLAVGDVVILENGFWSRAERKAVRQRAMELGVAVELRYLHVPAEERRRRVAVRNTEPGGIVIDLEVLTATTSSSSRRARTSWRASIRQPADTRAAAPLTPAADPLTPQPPATDPPTPAAPPLAPRPPIGRRRPPPPRRHAPEDQHPPIGPGHTAPPPTSIDP